MSFIVYKCKWYTKYSSSYPTDPQTEHMGDSNQDGGESPQEECTEAISLDSPATLSPPHRHHDSDIGDAPPSGEEEVQMVEVDVTEPSVVHQQQASGRGRRRRREAAADQDDSTGTHFFDLENALLKYQILQHRQVKLVNRNLVNMSAGLEAIATNVASLTNAINDLCQQVATDRAHHRHRERIMDARMERQTRGIARLANAVTSLSRRAIALQVDMGHFCGDVARGLGQITSAVDLLQNTQAMSGTGDTPQDSEESASSVSAADARAMRRSHTRNTVVENQSSGLRTRSQRK